MPSFSESVVCAAPAERIWRLLYDPRRYPEWLTGTARVEIEGESVTRYLEGYPDFPMPTRIESERRGQSVRISCLVSDIDLDFLLEPHPEGCLVRLEGRLPEHEAARLEPVQETSRAALASLAALAEGRGRQPAVG